MKKLYWRPQRVSLRVLLLLGFVALGAFGSVETFLVRERQPHYHEKMRAAQTALAAFQVLKSERLRRGIAIDSDTDPGQTGLVGELLSPVTTSVGHIGAKQTSVNPNFAAVMVDLLKKAEVREGDVVAVGFSGSFPAINVAVLAAIEAVRARPLIISSCGSSQWGANHPEFMWPDMERTLRDANLMAYKSIAATPGGVEDSALGLSSEGKELLKASVARNEVPFLEPSDYDDGIEQRIALLREHAGDADIRAYVNVGGGTTSVGTRVGKQLFKPGLNTSPPRGPSVDSVMTRFASQGVPVIHLLRIDEIAGRYGLPLQPQSMPAVGEGKVFVKFVYNRVLAACALAILLGAAVGLLRFDFGHRLFGRSSRRGVEVEPMV